MYWSFSFIISPSNEYSGLIFFRVDWFDFLIVQETLKSLLQQHTSKASIIIRHQNNYATAATAKSVTSVVSDSVSPHRRQPIRLPRPWDSPGNNTEVGSHFLLQNPSPKASIFQCSVFFMFQLTHPYMNTGKTIALIRQTFVSKVISILFNMLPRFVTAFLPRSKHILIL